MPAYAPCVGRTSASRQQQGRRGNSMVAEKKKKHVGNRNWTYDQPLGR
jgi:hypothetical protein